MNSSTRLRLAKEARALLPFWAAVASLMVVPFLLQLHHPVETAWSAYCFGCVLLGSVVIGQEFQHRTMGLLLSQPASRRRLWWEKMSVLGMALLGLLLWLVVIGSWDLDFVRSSFHPSDRVFGPVSALVVPLLLGFSTGPVLTLLARGTIGGIALMFLCAWSVWLLCYLLLPLDNGGKPDVTALCILFVIAFGLYPGALFLLGCRRFQHLEDIQGRGAELSLPAALTRFFAGFTERLTLNHGSALGHLVRKEVRLHLPAFVAAAGLVVLWLVVAAMFISPTLNKGFLLLPVVLLGLGIPVIAGIVSTAEERSLGLLDWHLTLPISARRQWCVKVIVALGVNVVLGILLPGVIGQVGGLLEGKSLELGVHSGERHFLIANAVIFCAALYASTVSANSMRALVGTIVLFLAGAMVLNFEGYAMSWIPRLATFNYIDADGRVSYHPISGLSAIVHHHRWLLGWSCLAVWLYFLGLAGFRRSLESFWLPVRRMAVFFAVVCAFVFAAIVW